MSRTEILPTDGDEGAAGAAGWRSRRHLPGALAVAVWAVPVLGALGAAVLAAAGLTVSPDAVAGGWCCPPVV